MLQAAAMLPVELAGLELDDKAGADDGLVPAGPAGPEVEGKEGKAGADDARYGGDEGGESKGTDAAPTAVVPGKPNRADPSAAHRTGDGMQGEEKQVVVDTVLLAKAEAGDVVALRGVYLAWRTSR